MILYLFKSTLCLAIFLLVYLLLLEKEKMHRFNRWYLLGSIVCSIAVPLISFTTELQPLPVLEEIQVRYVEFVNAGDLKTVQASIATQAKSIDWQNILLISYCIISIGLLIRFSRNIYLLLSRIGKNKVVRYGSAKLVLLKENVVSHTFLDHIFISETDYTDQTLEQEILIHELTHVQQKHSLDILFIEFLQAICWFNPLFIFYKKAIQLNHEFLADDAVIKSSTNIQAYQYLLLEKVCLSNNALLSSPFNFSVTKKRLVMMTRSSNQFSLLLKELSVIPLIAAMVIIFSSKISIAQNSNTSQPNSKTGDKTKPNKKVVTGRYISKYELPVISKTGATKEELDEFNSIVLRNTTKTAKGNHDIVTHTSPEDRSRLEAIYKNMNLEQRHEAKIGFERKMEPWAKTVPTTEQLNKWKNPENYGVWIDGKKITNEKLNEYKASDFSHYSASNLAYSEKMKKDVMESFHLKTMYKVQLDLMTNDGYEKYVAGIKAEPENRMYYHITKSPDGKSIEYRIAIQ